MSLTTSKESVMVDNVRSVFTSEVIQDFKPTNPFKREKHLCNCLGDENSVDNHENDPNEDDYEHLDYEGECFLAPNYCCQVQVKSGLNLRGLDRDFCCCSV